MIVLLRGGRKFFPWIASSRECLFEYSERDVIFTILSILSVYLVRKISYILYAELVSMCFYFKSFFFSFLFGRDLENRIL